MQAKCAVFLLVTLLVVAVQAGSVGSGPGAPCPDGYTWLGLGMCVNVTFLDKPSDPHIWPLINEEIIDDRLTWPESNDVCKKEGGRLVSLETPDKLARLSQYIHEEFTDLSYFRLWVGLRKNATGWRWLNSAEMPLRSNMWYPEAPFGNPTNAYGQILPNSQFKRHYITSAPVGVISSGHVCEAVSSTLA